VSNPFSNKAGKEGKPNPFSAGKKANPFSSSASNDTQATARHRSTTKERAAAVRAAEKAKGNGAREPKSVNNPWVREAFDLRQQLAEIDGKIKDFSNQYKQQLKVQKKAKTAEEIQSAFDRGDRLMSTVIGLCAQRRRLAGGRMT
jgi:TolA-binding protein